VALDSPLPDRIARMTVSPADTEGAPKIIFASIDAAYAREMEPRFAAAGCAVVSNSSAFRMAPNVPLVLPEVNAGHLHLIEEQSWRRESGGYIVTNSNCTAMGPVLALKPSTTSSASSRSSPPPCRRSAARAIRRTLPGHLDNVIPYIGNEEEKMEEETLKLLGKLEGHTVRPLAARMSASCNRVARRRRPHRQPFHQAQEARNPRTDSRRLGRVPSCRIASAHRAGAAGRVGSAKRSPAAAPRSQSRQRHGGHSGTPAPLRRA